MSAASQQKNMQDIFQLVSMDLGYIHGEYGEGTYGAKRIFLRKSAAFLRALGKDLGFIDMKVTTNPAGIAVSGDVTLMGLWSEGNGLYFQINEPLRPFNSFLYRSIKHMKDYTGGSNQWLPCAMFEIGAYESVVMTLSMLRRVEAVRYAA